MTIQESLEAVDENSDCSRGYAAQRFDAMCMLPYDENQPLVGRRRLLIAPSSRLPTPQANNLTTSSMRIAYLDCFSGVSGDMFLGALVDAGVPKQLFEQTVAALNIDARLEISRVKRNGISAIKVDVYSHGEKDQPREAYLEQHEEHSGPAHRHEELAHPHIHELEHAR